MSRMVRKQVYIEPRQEELLKRRSKELGVPEAELIRRGIDHITHASVAVNPNLELWKEMKTFIEQRRKMIVPQTGRTWTREELYDERLKRFSR